MVRCWYRCSLPFARRYKQRRGAKQVSFKPAGGAFALGLGPCGVFCQMVCSMRLLYNLLFFVFFLLSAPFYFFKMWRRGNWRGGFWQRFGFHGRAFRERKTEGRSVIWMHAVSVGEVNICVPLQREMAKLKPDADWIVSTTTTTGMGELLKKLPADVHKIYYPVDLFGAVARAWRAVRPTAVILVEAEIWPNFLWRAQRCSVPVMLVNARLSDRSHRGYRQWKFFFGPIFRQLAVVAAQSEEDCRRWIDVGVSEDRVQSVGNLKFDIAASTAAQHLDVNKLLADAGMQAGGLTLVAGSTHDGEEAILAEVFKRLRTEFPGLRLILVPRHMERAKAVAQELLDLGVSCRRRSRIGKEPNDSKPTIDCLLVDSTGELNDFYRVADVVFVGKSVMGKGGQNPIEPAAQGKPVLVGPHMENFRDVTRELLRGRGLIQLNGQNIAAQLHLSFRELLAEPKRREETGMAAKTTVKKNRGALLRTTRLCLDAG